MTFAITLVLARLLHHAAYGRYVVAIAWATLLVTPATLGLDRFLVRGMATYAERRDWRFARGLLVRTNQLVAVTSAVIACVGALVAVTVLSPDLRWPFLTAMVVIPLMALTLLRQGAMQALNRVVSGQFPEYIIRPLLILAGIGLTAWLFRRDLTATSAVAMNVGGVAVAFVVGAAMLRRSLRTEIRIAQPAYESLRWLRAALPMMVVSGVTTLNTYVSILLVGALRGPAAAGTYNVVQTAGVLITVVLMAANMPLAPAIATLYERKDHSALEKVTVGVARAAFAASIPLVAGFVLFPSLYFQLFGGGFGAGRDALIIVALAQLLNAAAGPSGNVLIMTRLEMSALRGILAGLVTCVVLDVALIPGLGVTGAAVGSAASVLVWNLYFVIVARTKLGINVTAFKTLSMATRSATRS